MQGDALLIYLRLLEMPGDAETMKVLADALGDQGESKLATAYRWAAERGRWPFERADRRSVKDKAFRELRVHDWDMEGREVPVPESARLPMELCRIIRRIPDRHYGDVNQAFFLLGEALAWTGDAPTGSAVGSKN